ncbi:MAG: hypothetical protein D3907_14200 [Candidatus Electrothrix sp. AUS3]|nr:hypothetical protein [Candidatus Electrothrix gigas]
MSYLKGKAERQGMKRYIKPVATGIGVFLFLLSGTFLTTGGFKINNAEAAGNSEAAVQSTLFLLLLQNGSSATETTLHYPIVDTGVSDYYSNNLLLPYKNLWLRIV